MTEAADELIDSYIPILDHGFVSLKDYMGGDQDIVEAARVSYGAGTRKLSDNRALIRYLVRHRHTSPLEMVRLKFHAKMPIFVARQWVRHRMVSLNECSMRYSLPAMQFYTPKRENACTQSKKNKQGRAEPIEDEFYRQAVDDWYSHRESAKFMYQKLVCKDIDLARELARIDLPLSTYTEWYWSIDLHNLFHFLSLRSDSHAQWEIQQYSNVMGAMAKAVAPLAFEAWLDYRYAAHTFSAAEMVVLRRFLMSSEDGLTTSGTESFLGNKEEMETLGMTGREINEFLSKFDTNKVPDDSDKFHIDPSIARTGEYFEKKAKESVLEDGLSLQEVYNARPRITRI